MKKNFLLLLVLTLLPLAGWAQSLVNFTPTVEWTSTLATEEFDYAALPDLNFPGRLTVQSYGFAPNSGWYRDRTVPCTSNGFGTTFPTASAAQYTYNIYASETATTPIAASDMVAGGTYVLRVFVKYISRETATRSWIPGFVGHYEWSWSNPGYTTQTYNLPFTISTKPEVTVKVFGIEKVWDDPFVDPTIADFNTTPELRQVTGATTNWNDVKDYLEFKRVENGTDVGSYVYTLSLKSVHPSYTLHIDNASGLLNITQATNTVVDATKVTIADWTYGGTASTPANDNAFKYGNDEVVYTYAVKGTTDFTDEVPTQAGEYTLKATVPETINYTEVSTTVDFKIKQYELVAGTDFTAPTALTGIVYNESAQEIAKAGEFIGPFKDEIIAAGAKFLYPTAEALPTEINVGTYSFDWTISVPATSNFKYPAGATTVSGATIVEAEITAADVTAPVGKTGLTYLLDTPQELIATGAVVKVDANTGSPKGEAYYSVDGGTWTKVLADVVGEHVKDGGYTISWYIKGDANHKDYGSETEPAGTVTVEISPVDFVLKADAEPATGLIYKAAAQELVAKSVTGGAPNMPKGSTTWSLDGTKLAAGSTYKDVKGTDAGTYTISYTVVPEDAKYEKDYNPYNYEFTAFIDQYTLYIGAKTLTGTVEDFFDLEADPVTPNFTIFDFLKDGAFLSDVAGDKDAQKAILNQLIASTQTMDEIFAASKAGSATVINLQPVTVDPDVTPMNYKVDDATLLSENAALNIEAINAKIQADPVGFAALEYTGEDQELVKTAAEGYKANGGTGSVEIGKVVYCLTVDGTYTDDLTAIVGKDAGTYKVYYKVELSDEATSLDRFYEYTDGAKSIDVAIAQAANEITNLALEGWTYGEEPNKPVADAKFKAEGEPTFTYSDSETGTFTEEVPTNAGTWYVKASVAETPNWAAAEKTISFEIAKADATCEAPAAIGELVYNGDDQALVEEPAYDGGTLEYSLDGTTWSEDIPTGKDAAEYEVSYRVVGDANHNDFTSTEPVKVTIAPKALSIDFFVFTAEEATYNFENQKPEFTLLDTEPITEADYEVAISYKNPKGEESELALTDEFINAGEYTFTFTGKNNYKETAEFVFTINKKDQEVTAPKAINLTYNGANQVLVEAGTTDADGLKYAINDGEFGELDVLPEAKDAGTYTVKYAYVENDNFNAAEGGEVEVTILKAEISYTLNNYTKDWDGEAFDEIEDLFAVNNGELFGDDKYDRPFDFVLNEQYKDAGDYDFTTAFKVVYKEGYPENYDVKVTGTAKIVINKVDIVATDYTAPTAIADLTYINGTAQDLVTAGEVTTTYLFDGAEEATPIGTFMYFVGEKAPAVPATEEEWAASEWSTEVPQGTDAGKYNIWYMVKGDKNHNNTEPVSIPNSIAANASGFQLAFADDIWTYDGVEFYPEDANAYDGDPEAEKPVVAVVGTDYDFTLTKDGEAFEGKLVDAGTYVFTYTGKGNYEGSSAEATIVIEPKELEDAMVELTAKTAEYNATSQKPEYTLTYTPEGKPALTLVEDKDFTVEAEAEMVTGGEYKFTFTGQGNYTGTATATFTITKRKVIAQAENCEKDYDGYYGLAIDGGTVEVPITWGGLVEGEAEENIPVAGEGAITVDPLKKDVGDYAIIVDGSKFISDNYEVIKGDREAWLTINPIDLKVKWAGKASKIYGAADPALASYLDITGAVGAEVEDIRANTVITRAEGETVGTYAVELSAKAGAKVFGNYNVTFEGANEAFEIKKAKLIASLAPQTVTYTGVKADLSKKYEDNGGVIPSDQLVVNGLISDAGLGIDDYKDVVSNIVVNIPDDAINVGDYEITLASADAANYEFEFLPATLTIEPADISKAVVTIPEQQVRVGDVAADVIDAENFTIEFEGFYAPDAAAFKVAAADRFVDGDGKIQNADNPETGLVLVSVDDDKAYNYIGWENFFGNLIVVGGETILLNDKEDIATTAKNGVNVTFTSRSIRQDDWNVLCLPFDVTIKQISNAFGYAAVDILNEAPEDGNMHFKVISSGTITAGTPFIVKPTSDEAAGAKSNFNQITFYGVDVKAFSANPEPVADNGGNKFCGTFMAQTTFFGEKFWYMSQGMWKQASKYTEANPAKLGAYRGYIELANADARIFIEEPDGTETAIDAISFGKVETADGWYTINGMKLDAAPTQKGTYINNGKKVIVK